MSILIKGVEMPENCIYLDEKANTKFCFFCNHDDTPFCAYRGAGLGIEDERPDWCPLVEVPTPHGRLIDADALQCKVDDIGLGYYEVLGVTGDTIDSAPTVIEAEGR